MAAKSKKSRKKGIARITHVGQPTNNNFQQDDVRIEEELERHHLEQLMYWFHVHQPTSAEDDDRGSRRLSPSNSSSSPFSVVSPPFSQRVRTRTRRRAGMLTLREFKDVLTKVIGTEIKEKQIENFFNKLDTASDGYVDWNEFCTYMLMQFRERDYIQTLRVLPFQSEAKIKHIVPNKQEPTVKIVSIDSPAKIITISKEGSMCVWSPSLHLEKSYRINGTDGSPQQQQTMKRRVREWVTDAVHLGNCHRLAISSTGRDIRFYDITTADQYYEELQLYGLSDVAVCLDYWFNEKMPGSRSLLLFGDDRGAVHVLYFLKPLRQLFAVPFGKKGEEVQRIYFPDLKYHSEFVSHVRLDMNFVEPIRRLTFLPENSYVALCTSHSKYSMVLAGVDNKNKSYVFSLSKGVDCFDYSRSLNALVTGSSDRMVRLWNAYVITRPVAVLVGHNTNVIDVKIIESRGIVISYSREAVVKVWDMKEYVCLQTVAVKFPNSHLGRLPDYGPFPMATTHSLVPKSVLVTANDYIAMLKLGQVTDPVFSSTPLTHKTQLCGALYNACLKQVVTAADDSSIGVWDATTGAKQMLYTGAHGREEITALTLDDTGRRLITGARNGTIKVWNVQNGHNLHQLESVDDTEVAGIVCVPEKKSILVVGWSRKIALYNDTEPDNLFIRANTDWKGGHLHNDDILSAAFCPPALLATASYDGEILIWFLETEILFKKLRKTRPIRTSARISAMTGIPQRAPSSRPNSRHRNTHKPLDGQAPPVDKLLFLLTRAEAKQSEAAILVSSEAGTLRWWSVFGQKTELGHFRACVDGDDCVLALCATEANDLLITGDTQGRITVWKISDYCVTPDDPSNSLAPDVASSWNAHSNVVVSVECFVYANSTYLLTASTDNTAKLWTLDGLAIGTFGQKKQWSLDDPLTWIEPPQWAIEEDERRTKELLMRSKENTEDDDDDEEDVDQENENETDDVKRSKPPPDNDIPLNHRKLKRLLSFGPESTSKNASQNESSSLQDRSKTFAFGSKIPIDSTRVSLGTRVAGQLERVRQDRQDRRRFMEGIDFSRTNRYGTLQCCAYQAVNMPELEEVKNPEKLFQSSQFPLKATTNNDSSLNSKNVVVKVGSIASRSAAPSSMFPPTTAPASSGLQ